MLHLFSDLETHIRITLVVALCFVFIYEVINGFHDTANSVVPVIYTCALRSHSAVIMSGIFNFLGVILSGVSVSYTIIHLLPAYFFVNTTANHILVMIFSMLFAAILWNLGTWYLGLPTSSSHTLIGSLIGISCANSIIIHYPITQGLNVTQLIYIFVSLVMSPVVGLILSRIIMILLFWCNNNAQCNEMHFTPTEQERLYGRKRPSLWIRIVLVISAAGVSFSHGANDGQKGIGLIMLLLVGVAPAGFMLNMNSNKDDIICTRNAVYDFKEYYIQNIDNFGTVVPSEIMSMPTLAALNQLAIIDPTIKKFIEVLANQHSCTDCNCCVPCLYTTVQVKKIFHDFSLTVTIINNALLLLESLNNYSDLNLDQRSQMRQLLMYIADILNQIVAHPEISYKNKKFLKHLKKNLLYTVEYAPTWIIMAIALSLSLGTTIGWKRVAVTIGEKIGKKEMTYAQGLSAQLTTAVSIGTASYIGMPVSTTHVLSSSITGSMLMRGWGVQGKIIKNILMNWILTLPVSIFLSGGVYLLILKFFI